MNPISSVELAELLNLTPEDYRKRFRNNKLTMGQISIVENYMGLSNEGAVNMFFPRIAWSGSKLKKEGGNLCQDTESTENKAKI